MDEAVLRAKRRLRVGADPDYDLLYENFDVLHYLLQAPDLIDEPDVDLIEHFRAKGRAKGLSPHPDFSVAEYVARYPHATAPRKGGNPFLYWLKSGRAAGEIADPAPNVERIAPILGLSPERVAELTAERRRDLQQRFRTGKLGEVFARAAQIEPLIGATWTEIARPHLAPLSRRLVVDELCTIYEAQAAAQFRRARVVFVIDQAGRGDRRIAGHLANALAGYVNPDEIVVIYTDGGGAGAADRFADGLRQIDFAGIAKDLRKDATEHALVMLLRSLRADAVVNVDSNLLYQAMGSYGRALAATERLFLCFCGNDRAAAGIRVGYAPSYFYRTFDYVAGVVTDSEHIARQLIETYRVDAKQQQRVHVFRAPADAALPVFSESPARPGRRPQVFWSGRGDRQARVDVLLEAATLMPEIDFRVWEDAQLISGRETPDNVRLEGTYESICDLPLAEADAWLYASRRDGVPSQLLDVAMTGIPVVASLTSGTAEVLGADDARPVAEEDGAEAYVAAIRAVLADPGDSRRRALALRERTLRERSEKAFATQVGDVLLVDHASGETGR